MSTDGDLWLTGVIRRASDWEFWYRKEWKSFPCDGNLHRQMPPTKFTPSTWLSGLVAEMPGLQIRELEPDESQHIELAFADTFAAIAATRSGW